MTVNDLEAALCDMQQIAYLLRIVRANLIRMGREDLAESLEWPFNSLDPVTAELFKLVGELKYGREPRDE